MLVGSGAGLSVAVGTTRIVGVLVGVATTTTITGVKLGPRVGVYVGSGVHVGSGVQIGAMVGDVTVAARVQATVAMAARASAAMVTMAVAVMDWRRRGMASCSASVERGADGTAGMVRAGFMPYIR